MLLHIVCAVTKMFRKRAGVHRLTVCLPTKDVDANKVPEHIFKIKKKSKFFKLLRNIIFIFVVEAVA